MRWINSHLLDKPDKTKLNNTIQNICNKYKINKPNIIKINKQLRANDGLYSLYKYFDGGVETEIQLAYKHYKLFGICSLDRVLRHELSHHICYMQGESINHTEYFKDICLEINGCLNEDFAIGKYKKLLYYGIETPYKWRYVCPVCGSSFKTKRKIRNENYCAKCLEAKIKDFRIYEV